MEQYIPESKIIVTMAYFKNLKASSLTTYKVNGIFKEFDNNSQYCEWTDLKGNSQPKVHINNIKFL